MRCCCGGELTRLTFDSPHIAGLAWGTGDSEILFSSNRGGLFAMWKVPVTGGEPQLVAASEDARFPASFDLSHDGPWFLFGRVDQMQNDIMLLQHFR